jgi:histone deacetylase HOS3
MRKIRINLITKSQKDAKARARLEAEKAKDSVSATGQANPVKTSSTAGHPSEVQSGDPNTIAASTETYNTSPALSLPVNPTPPATTASSGIATPLQEQDPFKPAAHVSQLASPPLSSPSIPSVSVHPSADADDVFIPYEPEGPAPKPIAQNEPLKWLPPNMPTPATQTPAATPSPVKKNKLFQYTSSSGIPFAPRSRPQAQGAAAAETVEPEVKQEADLPHSIEEIPETP